MDANVSKLDIPEPYFMFMNHEDISDVFVSAANKNESFSFMCPIISCAHIETNDDESLFEIKSKDGTITTAATKMIMIADGVASNMGDISILRELHLDMKGHWQCFSLMNMKQMSSIISEHI